jgi:transcriptional regulator with XRE-family HTH domain
MTRGYEHDPEFLLQDAKLAFAEQLEELLERRHMSRADLARRLGTSRAYVTRVLRAEFNLTLETIIRIGLALDARFVIGLQPTVRRERGHVPESRSHVQRHPAADALCVGEPVAKYEADGKRRKR